MGRKKISDEARNHIVTNFLRCTRKIQEQEGFDQVSTRKVAGYAGFTSTNIYLYFHDLDEMLMLAGMASWESCFRALDAAPASGPGSGQAYLDCWRILGQHSFRSPAYFFHFFFTAHGLPVPEMIHRYYTEIYPELPAASDGTALRMERASDPRTLLLRHFLPLCRRAGIPDADAAVLNEFLFSYFRTLLEQAVQAPGDASFQQRQAQLLHAAELLLCRIAVK